MRKSNIDHRRCGHPCTSKARAACRKEKAAERTPRAPSISSHQHCTHPVTKEANAACRKRRRDERVWAEEPPVVLESITDPRVRARVRSIAAEQEAQLDLRLLAAGLHITQRSITAAARTARPRP